MHKNRLNLVNGDPKIAPAPVTIEEITPGEISLVAIGKQHNHNYLSLEMAKLIKNCGLNASQCTLEADGIPYYNSQSPDCDKSLYKDKFEINSPIPMIDSVNAAKSAGISNILRIHNYNLDSCKNTHCWQNWINRWGDICQYFSSESNVRGFELMDEPSKPYFKYLSDANNIIQNTFSKTHYNVEIPTKANLYGIEASYRQLFGVDHPANFDPTDDYDVKQAYEKYVRDFITIINPNFLSYDYYPFKLGEDGTEFERDRFLWQLNFYGNLSKEYNKKFGSYILSSYISNRPRPTLPMIRIEAFAPLAYGAQALFFWCFFRSYTTPSGEEFELDAPIDINGNPTDIYDMVNSVAKEIKKYNYVFYNSEWVDAQQFLLNWNESEIVSSSLYPLNRISSRARRFLASKIRNGDAEYIIIINLYETGAKQVSIAFDKEVENLKTSEKGTLFTPTIDAGDWLIFKC